MNKGTNFTGITIEKGTLLTLGAKSVYFILSFIIGIIVARTTGPEAKGLYSLVILTASIASIIVGLGIPTANACLVGKKLNKGGSLLTNSVIWIITATIILGSGFIIIRLTTAYQKSIQYIGIALAVTPFMLLISLFAELLHGMNKIPEFNLVITAVPFWQVVILLMLIRKVDLNLALGSWAISNIIGAGMVSFILLRNTNIGRIDLPLLKEAIRFGVQVWLTQLIGTLNLRFDTYLIYYFLGAKEVGYYSVAVTISAFLFYIPSSLSVALLPRFTSADAKTATKIACQGIRVAVLAGFILLLILLGVGKVIVPLLYGQAFTNAIIPLLILLPGATIYGIAHITTAYFNGQVGRPIINTGLATLSLIIDVGLNLILIPRMGLNGAAIACSISYTGAMAVCLTIFKKISGASFKKILLVKLSDIREYYQGIKWNYQ